MPTPTRTATPEPGALGRIATARALATDAACAEVVEAWQQQGVASILLKGPTTAEWLYRSEARGYQDADLLVSPDTLDEAGTVLRELAFSPATQPDSPHAHPWRRESDGCVIDLHTTVWGLNRPPTQVWSELQRWVEPYRIGQVEVRVLGIPARALHLALHAAQHRDVPAPRTDLRRALERTTISTWRAAEQLADRLWGLPMMAVGLQLEPAGRELLRQLPLARAGLLVECEDAPLAIGLARLAAARDLRGKAAVLASGISTGARLRWLVAGLPRTVRSMHRAKANRWSLIDGE